MEVLGTFFHQSQYYSMQVYMSTDIDPLIFLYKVDREPQYGHFSVMGGIGPPNVHITIGSLVKPSLFFSQLCSKGRKGVSQPRLLFFSWDRKK